MQKPSIKSDRLLLSTEDEVFKILVTPSHPFRMLTALFNWEALTSPFLSCYSHTGSPGRDLEQGVKALLVQFWEDYSDREMESAIRENVAVRWFCGFGLLEDTPDHTYFNKLRTRLGTKRIADLFHAVNTTLQERGLFGNVFTFIDASAIVTKTALWEERDRAIEDGAKKLNNTNVEEYAADPDSRWGAKSKKKIWYGYKRHEAVDMRHGLVVKVATTPANVPDFVMTKNVAPKAGAVFSDKLYDTKSNDAVLISKGLYPATIRKNNNKTKIHRLDNWRSAVRMPFEGTFSKRLKRTKFRTLIKVTMQCFFEALIHNLKKAIRLLPFEPLLT